MQLLEPSQKEVHEVTSLSLNNILKLVPGMLIFKVILVLFPFTNTCNANLLWF